ncbi:MAG TPA: hypothetical protein VFH45_10710 [Acidimicrobiales bacterium]|nr:hypothetical protein [Acidimicrobiales bacterium]
MGDPAELWAELGFAVEGDRCRLGTVEIHLTGSGDGVGAWCLMAPGGRPVDAVDGLRTCPPPAAAGGPGDHPNGVTSIDHVVVGTPDLGRTVVALEAAGLQLRRRRDAAEVGRGSTEQAFFRPGEVIIEVVGPASPASRPGVGMGLHASEEAGAGAPAGAANPPAARLWGLALTCADLDATAAFLGPRLGDPRPAVQRGRRIATLRRQAGSTVPLAFMSAEGAGQDLAGP